MTSGTFVKSSSWLVLGLDLLILAGAGLMALQTRQAVAESPDSLAGLGYFIAMMIAAVALPSLILAVAALLTRGATAVACATLSMISLAACAAFAVSYV